MRQYYPERHHHTKASAFQHESTLYMKIYLLLLQMVFPSERD